MSLNLSNVYRLPTFLFFSYPGKFYVSTAALPCMQITVFSYIGESLIAYIILMAIVGLPLYVIELSLGQFGRTGIVQLWRAVPLLKGVNI